MNPRPPTPPSPTAPGSTGPRWITEGDALRAQLRAAAAAPGTAELELDDQRWPAVLVAPAAGDRQLLVFPAEAGAPVPAPPVGSELLVRCGSGESSCRFWTTTLGVNPDGAWTLEMPRMVERFDRRAARRKRVFGHEAFRFRVQLDGGGAATWPVYDVSASGISLLLPLGGLAIGPEDELNGVLDLPDGLRIAVQVRVVSLRPLADTPSVLVGLRLVGLGARQLDLLASAVAVHGVPVH
jgi:hypothetical protein